LGVRVPVRSARNVELEGSGLIFRDRSDVETYRQAAERTQKAAMSPDVTKGLVAEMISELETRDDDTART